MSLAVKKRWLLIAGGFLLLSAVFHFGYYGVVADPDSFYHLTHSRLYLQNGILDSSFPWTQYSAINQQASDLWYGFHIITIPLALFANTFTGIKIGGAIFTALILLIFYLTFNRLKVKWPFLWTLLLAFISADLLYRLLMFRPQLISLGLSLFLFAVLAAPSEKKRWDYILLFAIGTLAAWTHLALSWLPILIALTISGTRLIYYVCPNATPPSAGWMKGVFKIAAEPPLLEAKPLDAPGVSPGKLYKQKMVWPGLAALGGGLIAGWLLRPNPVGALKLAYIQIAQLLFEKQGDLPLLFGRELTPFTSTNFIDQLIPITLLIVVGVGLFLAARKKLSAESKIILLSSLFLSVVFYILTFAVARRSVEVMITFGLIFVAYIFSQESSRLNRNPILGLVIILAIAYAPFHTIYRNNIYMSNAYSPEPFKEAALWLKDNSQAGEIVFNIHWDRFGQLFYWNQHNYYINGMDPIFQYAYNPSLYWKNHFWMIDKATAFTCGEIRCTPEMVEDTYQALTRDFNASYIFIEKLRSPNFYAYLTSPQYEEVFADARTAVLRILK